MTIVKIFIVLAPHKILTEKRRKKCHKKTHFIKTGGRISFGQIQQEKIFVTSSLKTRDCVGQGKSTARISAER